MTKSIYALAIALVLGTTGALAGGNNQDHTCQGGHNCNVEGGGGPNENTNTNENNSSANAGAIAGSSSDSTATGIGVGGSSVVGVAVKTGPTVSGSQSNATGGQGGTGGSSVANGGDSVAFGGSSRSSSYTGDSESSVGDVTSSSGDSSASSSSGGNEQNLGISIRGDSVTYEDSASRAATVYAQVCQSGGSAQAKAGGFSVVNSEPLCEHLKMAAVMREAYVWELHNGSAVCQDMMDGTKVGTGDEYSDTCFNEKAVKYYNSYHEHMKDAMLLMDKTEEAGLVDKFAGYMVRPMALIGALIWLL
jgi:hypothetical protein